MLTFDPHPTHVVAPERAPRLITSPERRAELMGEEGIEQVLILPFTRELSLALARRFRPPTAGASGWARRPFWWAIISASAIARRAISKCWRSWGQRFGFETEIVPAIAWRGRMVSSSAIRGMILHGQVSLAARFLERPYGIEGDVVSGRGVGSKQTVPTLNLATTAELIPERGVYVTRTRDLDGTAAGTPSPTSGTAPRSDKAMSSPSKRSCSSRW